jgi:SAM-dependent methyltransferase
VRVTVTATLLGGLRPEFVAPDSWEELDACPICGSGKHLRDVGVVRAAEPGPVTAACLDCQYVFMRRRPSRAWFADFYARSWDAAGRARAERDVRVRADHKVARFCAPELGTRARVLDVGAGFGQQLLAFRELGHDVAGIEASEHRASYVRERLGIPCVEAPIEQAEAFSDLDLVFSHHVLEHVHDPVEAIEACRRMLSPGGRIYVAVPNLWHEFPPQTFHFVPHLSVFTLPSLGRLLARAGCRIVQSEETVELQVLAALGAPDARPSSSDQFEPQLGTWARAPFGPPGRHALLWQKAPGAKKLYESRTVSPAAPRIRAARAAIAVGEALPRRPAAAWRMLSRRAAHPSTRALTVEVEDTEPPLPLVLQYPGDRPPVWVK